MSITITGWIGIVIGLAAGWFIGIIMGGHFVDHYWKEKVSRIYEHARNLYEQQVPYEISKEENKQDD